MSDATGPKDDRKGHRNRLRERFAADYGASMPDYELLELLLFHAVPRRDTKPLAKRLIARFGSLAAVLAADAGDIADVEDSGPAVATMLKAVNQAGRRLAREDLRTSPVLGSWDKVIDYCRAELGHLPRESFHVLFLDQKNALLAAEEQSTGTVNQTSVYPREVVKAGARAECQRAGDGAQPPVGRPDAEWRGYRHHPRRRGRRQSGRHYPARPCHRHAGRPYEPESRRPDLTKRRN